MVVEGLATANANQSPVAGGQGCLVMMRDRVTSERRLVTMSPEQAQRVMLQSRGDPRQPQITSAEIDAIQMQALDMAMARQLQIAEPEQPESSQGQAQLHARGATPSQKERQKRGGKLPPPRR